MARQRKKKYHSRARGLADWCAHETAHRVHRAGWPEWFPGLVGFRPHRCSICGARFWRRSHGISAWFWPVSLSLAALFAAFVWAVYPEVKALFNPQPLRVF